MSRLGAALLAAATGSVLAGPALAPIAGPAPTPALPWRAAWLPGQKLPHTRFDIVDLDGARVLRVESSASYGNLLHAIDAALPGPPVLSWRWRLERAIAGADLQRKAGDDTAAKICVMFDHALDRVPFIERQLLRIARARTGEALPAATLCYVWDPSLAAGTLLPNAYTRRLRWIVLQGAGSPLGTWRTERRELRADFLRAFGDEALELPRISAVLVGADADNTGGHGLAYVADLVLE